MAHKSPLGKGLASLLTAPKEQVKKENVSENKDKFLGITILKSEQIHVNTFQPRREFDKKTLEELAQSIRESGIIQPLVVRKTAQGHYELIAGERRLRASKLAGLTQVPVVLRKSTDQESLELALIENIQRENLNCVDEALAYSQLMDDFHLTMDQVAQKVGKDISTVTNVVRILKLPPSILQDLRDGKLTLGHAKAILGLETMDLKLYVRNQVCEKGLNVRQTEAFVLELKRKKTVVGENNSEVKTNRFLGVCNDLMKYLGAKVAWSGNNRKGKIMIHYASPDELQKILEKLLGKTV
jgi:ParB family chromosome partitioning protein